MSNKNSPALKNTAVSSAGPLQCGGVHLDTYRKEEMLVESDESLTQEEPQEPGSAAIGEIEDEELPGTIDDHLAHALANLEVELDTVQEVKGELETTKDRLNQLNEQLQKARSETEEARSELDALHLMEARTKAELEVVQVGRLRLEAEIRQTKPLIEQLQQQVKQAKIDLREANEKFRTAQSIRDGEKVEIEKAKQALYVTGALESQILTEIESARTSTERNRHQTQEIQNCLESLQNQLEDVRSATSQAQVELQNARIAEAKMQAEIAERSSQEMLPQMTHENVTTAELPTQPSDPKSQSDIAASSIGINTEPRHQAIQIPPNLVHLPVDPDAPVIPSKIIKNPVWLDDLEHSLEQHISAVSTEQLRQESEGDGKHVVDQTEVDQNHNLPDEPAEKIAAASTAETVYNLADAGYQVDEIAKATNIAQGPVELLLKMRNLKLET